LRAAVASFKRVASACICCSVSNEDSSASSWYRS
jgi:hypothetical protein